MRVWDQMEDQSGHDAPKPTEAEIEVREVAGRYIRSAEIEYDAYDFAGHPRAGRRRGGRVRRHTPHRGAVARDVRRRLDRPRRLRPSCLPWGLRRRAIGLLR